ncbi:MAG: four helix bundle protein [Flammeovirgaceae bacterium]|nr:four helix bundle protein [Flammeovirgaceae bacterium]
MRNDKPNIIVDLTFEFSLKIIEFIELLESKRKFNLANQLFRSGTSIGANVWEAQDAESKADFIHKFKISSKEVNETKYWLLLCKSAKSYPDSSLLLAELETIQKVISKLLHHLRSNLQINFIFKFSNQIC